MPAASRVLLALAVLMATSGSAAAQTPDARGASDVPLVTARYDPRLRFRSLETPRFTIHYHQEEEALARRLAQIAEETASALAPRIGAAAARVHVILVNQTDQSNGWATVLPYNLIEITAAAPPAHSFIGNTDDWLRVVFVHEYTHVVHLEKSGGPVGALRRVFGRLPLFYPNLALPGWQVEGLAVYEESAATGRGRVPAGGFRMLLDHAAAADRFAPLDRAAGGVVDWPSGHVPYLYGAYFHQFLADRYGEASLRRLADETARRLPFFGSRAFREVYGRPLGALWSEFADEVARRHAVNAPAGRERLTRHGFVVTSPAFSADGRLFYSTENPHGFPAIVERRRDAGPPREVASRYRGDRLAVAGDLLVFDQMEVEANVGIRSDLYAAGVEDGRVRRLTRGARAADPDVAPDGRTIVCTVQQADRRVLATLTLPATGGFAEPSVLVSEPSTDFGSPRWSPDGRSIAAERRRPGVASEIVIVDVATRTVTPLASSSGGRDVLPAWLPDGTVLFSSERDGRPFTLYAADAASGRVRRVRNAGDGAHAPALSPDGTTLVFVAYSADGYDLYSLPFGALAWDDVPERRTAGRQADARPQASRAVGSDAPYRPWRTLAPRFWTPVVESEADDFTVGAATGGIDALGRHAYAARLGWMLRRGVPDWQVDYTYSRWRPSLFVSASVDRVEERTRAIRARELTAGALLPLRRVRWSTAGLAALHAADLECSGCTPDTAVPRRIAARAGWTLTTARSYGYSISREDGVALTVTSELTRRALGASGDAGAATLDARGYLPVPPRHGVLAGRVAAAAAWGDEPLRRVFTAGGTGAHGGFDFGAGAVGLLRGFAETDLLGHRAVVANVDYRFPIAWVQRGAGTLPFLLRSVHGAVFADVGHAWAGRFRRADLRRAYGVELSIDAVLGYALPLTFTAGAAWRDGGGERGAAVFGRIGRAF